MENQNQIRVCNNDAFIVGKLKEKKITFTRDSAGKVMATGYLVLSTNTKYGKGEVRVSVMQYELTKEGKENSLYKALLTIQNEYKSSVETGSIETADLIKIQGSLNDETYYSTKKEDFVEKVGARATFINRTTREKEAEDKVNIMLEGYIAETKPVGEELEVKFITIGYGGVAIPIVGYVPKELVVPFQGRHQVGQTTTLYFAIVNSVEVKELETEHGFGDSFGETIEKVTIKNVIFGGGAINYNQAYTPDQIRQALSLREVKLEERKTKAIEKEKKAGNMTTGFGAPTGQSQGTTGFGMAMGVGTGTGGFNMPTGGFNMGAASGFNMPSGV